MDQCTQTQFSTEELERMAAGEFFGEDAPLLPSGQMRMVSAIEDVSREGGAYGKGFVRGRLDLSPEDWFFKCHFITDPVMPGCLGLDGMWQLMGFYLAWLGHRGKARALGVKELKFTGQVLPRNKVVTYVIDVRRVLNLRLTMLIGDGTLFVDDRKIYFAKDMRVGLFSAEGLEAAMAG